MKKLFDKNISRREFLTGSAKVLAAYSALGIFADSVFAKKVETATAAEKTFEVEKFLTLDEMKIGRVNLDFDEMDVREYTGAIVIHHSGLLRGDVDSTVQELHDLHKNGNGWSGVGYHFVIHKDGTVEHARPLEYCGAHTFKNNEFTVGICLAGNYQLAEPPVVQVKSAVQLIGALCKEYNFAPTDTTIFGHRDLGKTACPGKNLYALLPQIIGNAQCVMRNAQLLKAKS